MEEGGNYLKIYIAGKITGNPDYKKQFAKAEKHLQEKGHLVLNPAVFPKGFTPEEYMKICYSMIDVCEGVFFLDNWPNSRGARMEHAYARQRNKKIIFHTEEGERWRKSRKNTP